MLYMGQKFHTVTLLFMKVFTEFISWSPLKTSSTSRTLVLAIPWIGCQYLDEHNNENGLLWKSWPSRAKHPHFIDVGVSHSLQILWKLQINSPIPCLLQRKFTFLSSSEEAENNQVLCFLLMWTNLKGNTLLDVVSSAARITLGTRKQGKKLSQCSLLC